MSMGSSAAGRESEWELQKLWSQSGFPVQFSNLSLKDLLNYSAWFMIASAVSTVLLLTLTKLKADYGRYSSTIKWPCFNFLVPAKAAWFIQEIPSFLVTVLIVGYYRPPMINLLMIGMFLVHYFQRCFIFPFLIRGGKPTPGMTMMMAFGFCLWNAWMQSTHNSKFAQYSEHHLYRPGVLFGIGMWMSGMMINIHSDGILRNLRKPGETGYKIPRGGLFELVSGANFLGEILEWFGWALACQTLPSLAFALFTLSNIGPRAYQHHQWYKSKFEDYPSNRKALIPFII